MSLLLIDFQTLCKCHFCLSIFAVQKRSKDHLKLNYFSYSINHLSFQFLIFFLPSLKSYIFWQLECSVVPYMVLLHFYVDVFWWGCSLFTQVEHYKKLKANYGPANVFWSFLWNLPQCVTVFKEVHEERLRGTLEPPP